MTSRQDRSQRLPSAKCAAGRLFSAQLPCEPNPTCMSLSRYIDLRISGGPRRRLIVQPSRTAAQLPAPSSGGEGRARLPRAGREPERNEGRSRARGDMRVPLASRRDRKPAWPEVRERHASTRDWNADLAGVEVASEDQVE